MHARMQTRTWAAAAIVAALGAALGGCGSPPNRILIETHTADGVPQTYSTDFADAVFAPTADGGYDVVLRWKQPTDVDPTQDMEQLLYARVLWTPRPGVTRAEATMINARTAYTILTPPTGVRYEGGCFLSFKLNRAGTRLTGRIESGELAPLRLVGGARQPFGPARISGRIDARLDRRTTARLLHDIDVKLGTPGT